MSRILLVTWGSLGDLHPLFALGLSLRDRGHEIVIAAPQYYQDRIESLGLEFHPIRPSVPEDPEIIEPMMDPKLGPKLVLKNLILDNVRDTYADVMAIAQTADFMITHEIIYVASTVAEVLKLPWATCVLSPASFFSAYDPLVTSVYPALAKLYRLGPGVNRWVIQLMDFATRSWIKPLNQLRQELGLLPVQNPIIRDKHSPDLVLALFSSVLSTPQPDWPPNVVTTGFTFYDGATEQSMAPELQSWLDAGDPPLVFTLGSAAVAVPGQFYIESVQAALQLNCRAVLLMGSNPLPQDLPASIFACEYAPYSELFPRACAIVHQGGIGTTAQGLRAGRPALIVPYSHDQPDNAARLQRLGVSRTLQRHQYEAKSVVRELTALLADPQYAAKATAVRRIIETEAGVQVACDAIAAQLKTCSAQKASASTPDK